MRTFRATALQDNTIPWKSWDDSPNTRIRDEVWGVTIIPCPVYASLDEHDNGVGEPLYYEWQALVDPEIALPDWITEVVE
jgi:hypothetical protein